VNQAPIGVFDSGVGGLTVAAQILKKLPSESVLYLADTIHVPYGERPLDEIRSFAVDITGFLRSLGAKMVVMACNMSSAVGLEASREAFPDIPVLGVIKPGARAAAEIAGVKPIGVLATTGTVSSRAYSSSVAAVCPRTAVFEQACPRFVPLVENGDADSPDAYAAAREYVEPLLREGVGTIILGCTHYPFLISAISAAAGPSVQIVDPAEETVRQVAKTLSERNIQAPPAIVPVHRFFCTGDRDSFAQVGGRFLGRNIERVEQPVWGVDLGKVLA
jgi:glutamate racemase